MFFKISLLIFLIFGTLQQDPVIIIAVSTRIGVNNASPIGSLRGGTQLYIQATGLDPTSSNNAVTIGRYPCIVSDKGVNGIYLTCVTSAPDPKDDNLANLPIGITVARNPMPATSTCTFSTYYCYFSYQENYTPLLHYVTPRSIYPRFTSVWNAMFTVSSNEEKWIEGQYIGNERCDRFDIKNDWPDEIKFWNDNVACQVSGNIAAGYYEYLLNTANGYEKDGFGLWQRKVSVDELYQSKIVPFIIKLSSNFVSPQGQYLKITGYGFSANTADITITIPGSSTPVQVISASNREIEALIPPLTAPIDTKFLQSSGLRYTRYDLSESQLLNNCGNFRTQILNNPNQISSLIVEDGIYPEPEQQDTLGKNYGEYYRGFFKAPQTGNYKFYLSSDDCATVYLQTIPGEISQSTMTLINSNQLTPFRNYWYGQESDTPTTISAPQSLVKDNYYYIEIYHSNGAGVGHLTVSVDFEFPTRQKRSLFDLFVVKTSYTAIHEQLTIKLYNQAANTQLTGQYTLNFVRKDSTLNGINYSYITAAISPTASASNLETSLNNVGYKVSVIATKVDNTGTALIDQTASNFAGYVYQVTFLNYRGPTPYQAIPTLSNSTLNGGTIFFQASQTKIPCDPISGTFQLSIDVLDSTGLASPFVFYYTDSAGNKKYDLPYDVDPAIIANNINQIYGTTPLYWTTGTPSDGYNIHLYTRGIEEITNFKVSSNRLVSGNGAVVADVINQIPKSNNVLFEPIPNELLFQFSQTPQVQVSVKGFLAGCPDTICDFSLSNSQTSKVLSFTQVGKQMSVTLVPGQGLSTLTFNQIKITFAGANCLPISLTKVGENYIATCPLEEQNGVIVSQAGENVPQVHIDPIGFTLYDAAVTAITQELTVTQVSPAAGSPDGGTQLILNGVGFPKDFNQVGFILTVSGVAITPISISNTQIVLNTPKQSTDGTIQLSFNGKTFTSASLFTYDPILRLQVSQLSFDNQSPVFKGNLIITATNLGNIATDLNVTLEGNTNQKIYIAPVVSLDTAAGQVTVYLRGGMPGDYVVVVNRKNYGRSSSVSPGDNLFTFGAFITGVQPNSGSEAGGTIITITGYNFVVSESLAFIGDAVNWYCDIDASKSSSTQIICTTPPKSEESNYSMGPVKVAVVTRGSLESICASGSTCTFQYLAENTPIISSLPLGALSTQGARLLSEEEMITPTNLKFKEERKFLWTQEFKKQGLNHLQHYGTSKRRNLLTAYDIVLDHFKIYNSGDTETLSVSGFSDPVKVFFKGVKQNFQTTATLSGSILTYTIPQLTQGDYGTYVQTAFGYGNKIWISRVKLTLSTITPSSVVAGGQEITIDGQGFNAEQDFSIYFGTNIFCLEVNVISTTQATCRTPSLNPGAYKVTITQKDIATSVVVTGIINNGLTVLSTASSPQVSAFPTTLTITSNETNMVYNGDVEALTFTFSGTNLDGTIAIISLEASAKKYTGTIISKSATSITVSFNNVPIGIYLIQYQIDGKYAFWTTSAQQKLAILGQAPSTTLTTSSYAGGAALTFNGKGFDTTLANNQVTICGFKAKVSAATFTTLTVEAPLFRSAGVFTTYSSLKPDFTLLTPDQVILTSDQTNQVVPDDFFDSLQTTYYSSTAASCFIQIDFGPDKIYELQALRYIPRVDNLAIIFNGSKFQYSTDGTNFLDLFTVGPSVHSGFNIFAPSSTIQGIKKIKFIDSRGSTGSKCQIAEVELRGRITHGTTNPSTTPTICGAQININGYSLPSVINVVSYSDIVTPTVATVSPTFVPNGGSNTLTITGTGFGTETANVQVKIDNIPCTVNTVTDIQVICTTGVKDPSTNSVIGQFSVSVNGNLAVNSNIARYGNLWSDLNTWGGVVAPGDGDSIVVEAGQTLVVDTITPKLVQLLVQGNLYFADNGSPVSLDAHYIVISDGKFQLGTETQPFQSQATITLRGVYEDVQMPALGNKVLGCHMCTFDLHGKVRTPTWTLLSTTIEVGSLTLTVDDEVDWEVGEQIVVTSSEVEHTQAEVRTIASIIGKTITVDQPFIYQHYSAIEIYGTIEFPMKTEVGLLSRNVKVIGEPSKENYGYHLMIHGDAAMGTQGRISYAEFTNGGQPVIKGRYPIHFHLNGDVYGSYVRGNSIHDNYARCVTIHGVHFLTIEKNVCYKTFGHAIFLEDGIETDNIIQDNLVAGARQVWNMLQTDTTVASYWITNPQNIVRRNRSGGSEWYAFWYEIKENPDGPSATSDICPPGLNVLEFDTNYAHSNGRFGLRIFQLQPRQFPCNPPRNDTNPDPFMDNPSIPGEFSNFWTWKNNEAGVLAEEVGTITLRNMYIAESGLAGFQGHKANYTKEGSLFTNSLIVGKSGNPNIDTYYKDTYAMIVPRTNGFSATNIQIYNFPAGSTIIQSCSVCWHFKIWVQGGKNTKFQNISIQNSNDANYIFWQKHRREIFWDLDGSITGVSGGAFITPFKQHFVGISACTQHPEAKWNNSHICAMSQVQVRDILINNPTPQLDFRGTDMKIYRLDPSQYSMNLPSTITADQYQNETMKLIMKSKDMAWSFASDFVTGFVYNIHFQYGASDPRSMGVFASPLFDPNDKGIVLRFNYSAIRETFDIYKNEGGQFTKTYLNISRIPDPATCNQGDWHIDDINKFLFLCLSGKRKSFQEFVEIQAVICRNTCGTIGNAPLENKLRLWSDPASWKDNQVPSFNSSPIVQAGYQILIDIDPPALYNLTVLGNLIFDESKPSTKLQANYIFARTGKILAGNATHHFPGAITIQLNGNFGEDALLIDDQVDSSNKVLAVTNGLELYGKSPETTWTRLTSFASAGDKIIDVDSATGWQVGDQIVIGPSGSDAIQNEARSITAISGTTVTLNSPLLYDHFGAPQITIDRPIGQLDLRSAVGHLTRDIKIIGGSDPNGWGGRVLIYQFLEPDSQTGIPRRGYAVLQGVEFINMGQYDTSRAALDFRQLNSDLIKTPSIVSGCTFHDSTGMFINAQNSQYITVTNNVFYNGQKALVQMNNNQYIKFQNNLLILVTVRPLAVSGLANWAVFANFNYDDGKTPMTTDYLEVSGNLGQGSQDTGFFFMATKCSLSHKAAFHDNQCSGAFLACYGITQSDGNCDYFEGANAYHSQHGVHAALLTNELRIDSLILAENNINLVMKMGNQQVLSNVFTLFNSYISAFAIPSCAKCYSNSLKPYCKGTIGVQMGTVTTSAFPPISKKPSTAYDTICTMQTIDGRVYVDGVTFDGFKHQYTETNYCSQNAAFRQHHHAPDSTAQHYLTNTICQNCNNEGLLYGLRNPDISLLGWFGGCGSFVCTGQINILIEDQDGSFFGQVGQAIGNNTYFGPNVTYCTRKEIWNGYFCKGNQITVLNFQSTAADHDSRLYSPVKLTDGLFFNEINSYKEWDWDGPEPMNKRDSRFVAIVSVNTTINMTNAGTNPAQSQYWLSKRSQSGSPTDWVIIKLQFSGPQVIQIAINGTIQRPGLTVDNAHWDLSTKTSVCGANNYFYQNRTIHFVVNGASNCIVQVSLKNTLQITSRIAVSVDQFFGPNFISFAVGQLGGDPYNYFILGTKSVKRRQLQEVTAETEVQWGILDVSTVGESSSVGATTRLQVIQAQVQKLQDAVGSPYKIQSSQTTVHALETVNYPSTEPITDVSLKPGGSSNNQENGTQSGQTDTNPVIGTGTGTVAGAGQGSGEQKDQNQGTSIQKQMISSNNDQTLIIVVAVVFSVIGVSLIIAGLLWYKKNKLAKIAAMRAQRVDNEFNKDNNSDDHIIALQHPEQSH